MNEECSYTAITEAKDGSLIPLRKEIAFHSKYNPVREGQQFASQCAGSPEDTFFIILGICGAFHIEALRNAFPHSSILAVEKNQADLNFVKKLPLAEKLLQDSRIILTSAENLQETLFTRFIPAEYSAIQLLSLRAWEQNFTDEARAIKECVQKTLSAISADFSVQSHFGGIWQRNIFVNLRQAADFTPSSMTFDRSKKAAVIAAGPSLDQSVEELKKERDAYVIIATDTAYRALLRHGIVSDVAVSVDAQMISHAHFFEAKKESHFVLDLSANPATARTLSRQAPLHFVQTGHPLSAYASQLSKTPLASLQAGSGTVTIAAADFAIQAGFDELVFFGADFAYHQGKAYASGTYLDDLYNTKSGRLKPAESFFDALLFRTPLIQKGEGVYSTEVLDSYRKSLDAFLTVNNFTKKADNTYIRTGKAEKAKAAGQESLLKTEAFNFTAFSQAYKKELRMSQDTGSRNSPLWLTLLPYIAWLRRIRGTAESFTEIVRQAYRKTLEYTELI